MEENAYFAYMSYSESIVKESQGRNTKQRARGKN